MQKIEVSSYFPSIGKMMHTIIKAENVAPSEYKFITEEGNVYYYKFPDTTSETFLKEDMRWRERVCEGQAILLEWIQTQEHTSSPAYIRWNYERKAMIRVKLTSIFNSDPNSNVFATEINPFEWKDGDGWVVDNACPFAAGRFRH